MTLTFSSPVPVRRDPKHVPALVAAAGDHYAHEGDHITSQQLIDALDRRRRSINTSSHLDGDYVKVATFEFPRVEERHLQSLNNPGPKGAAPYSANNEKIDSVTAPEALTAAGVCAPFVIDYGIDAIGTVARPVRDSLPQWTADRGGVQFRRDVDALGSGPISASGTWTLATDAAPGEDDVKPVWDVPCSEVVQAEVQAVTLGLRFSNITSKYDPEATKANTRAANVAHARYAETLLLNSIFAQSTATFTESSRLGATRDLLAALDKAQAYVRDNRRIGHDVPLRTILPHWTLNLMRADLTRALHTSSTEMLGQADEVIMAFFQNRGISVSWSLDSQNYSVRTGTGVIPPFPDTVEFPLFPEGTFIYLDGGTLDVGLVRDQKLVEQNRYVQFQETFEGIARRGVEAVRMQCTIQPTGGSAGTVSTATFTD